MTKRTKRCTRCGLVKPVEEFHAADQLDGRASACADCLTRQQREKRKKTRQMAAIRQRAIEKAAEYLSEALGHDREVTIDVIREAGNRNRIN